MWCSFHRPPFDPTQKLGFQRMLVEASQCRMCDALARGDKHTVDEPIAFSEGAVAIASLGALVVGWTLVVPSRHVLSLRELRPTELMDFIAFADDMRSRVTDRFGDCVVFEHGPARAGTVVGCGVDHAHLHVVPWSKDGLVERIRQEAPQLSWVNGVGLADLDQIPAAVPYLWIEAQNGQRVAYGDSIPSQLVRRVIAAELGVPDSYDWKSEPRLANTLATASELRASDAALALGRRN
jgi:ATP adenylyltransferase